MTLERAELLINLVATWTEATMARDKAQREVIATARTVLLEEGYAAVDLVGELDEDAMKRATDLAFSAVRRANE